MLINGESTFKSNNTNFVQLAYFAKYYKLKCLTLVRHSESIILLLTVQ